MISGYCNTSVGAFSGEAMVNCNDNSFFGAGAGNQITYGNANVAVGSNSFYQTPNGNDNVAIGYLALFGNQLFQAYKNVYIGSQSGADSKGTICGNIFIGFDSGRWGINTYCTCVGYSSNVGDFNTRTKYGSTLGAFTNTNQFNNSTCIGAYSQSTDSNQITLGTRNEYVFCPSTVTISSNVFVGGSIYTNSIAIGTFLSNRANSVSVTSSTNYNAGQLSLTKGSWIINFNVYCTGTPSTFAIISISASSASRDGDNQLNIPNVTPAWANMNITRIVSISSTTTYYGVFYFESSGISSINGYLTAVKIA
jgi:hypothetical protein